MNSDTFIKLNYYNPDRMTIDEWSDHHYLVAEHNHYNGVSRLTWHLLPVIMDLQQNGQTQEHVDAINTIVDYYNSQ